MKKRPVRRVEPWTVEKLQEARSRLSFPEYQRQSSLWTDEKKSLLIDSILKQIEIPKLYFNETAPGHFDVIDGQQRLWAIWEYLDDEYAYDGKKFSKLSPAQKDAIRDYPLEVTVFDDASDDYLRELFVRLQLGLLLVAGEKLNAATGMMKDFVFVQMKGHHFIKALNVPERRYAKQTLCAQITINSFSRAKNNQFSRTRYEDLSFFFEEYEKPLGEDLALFKRQTKAILSVLDDLDAYFGSRSGELSNRSYILSIYLLVEQLRNELTTTKDKRQLVEFVFALWARLRQEIKAGIDRHNRELYAFETMLSSAPGERYQIERRHQRLLDYWTYFKKHGKVKGD
jgi:hypothetical protein